MNTGNWKIIFHSFLGKDLFMFLYKRVSKLQILSVPTETSRETPSTARRQEKSCFCVITNTKSNIKVRWNFL